MCTMCLCCDLVVTGPGKYESYPFRSAVVETEADPNNTSIAYAVNDPGVWADPNNTSIAYVVNV